MKVRQGGERPQGMGLSPLLRQEHYEEESLESGQSTLETDIDEQDARPMMNHIEIDGIEELEV